MNWILLKAVFRARAKGLLHLTPADKPTRLDCLADKCAKCCKNLGSPILTQQEAEKIDQKHIFKNKYGLFIKSTDCTCSLLQNNLCSIYQHRPKGCREYPWYNIDGRLYYDQGCPGIKHDRDQRPALDEVQPFKAFFPRTSKILLRIIKIICIRN